MSDKYIKGDITRLIKALNKISTAYDKTSDACKIIDSCNVVKLSEFKSTQESLNSCKSALIEIQKEINSLILIQGGNT